MPIIIFPEASTSGELASRVLTTPNGISDFTNIVLDDKRVRVFFSVDAIFRIAEVRKPARRGRCQARKDDEEAATRAPG